MTKEQLSIDNESAPSTEKLPLPRSPDLYVCTKVLTPIEFAVLTLIHLDPNLSRPEHRDQLRLLAKLIDPSFTKGRVGFALTQLLHYRIARQSQLLSWCFDKSVPETLPPLALAAQTLCELSLALDSDWSMEGSIHLYKALRLMGYYVSPSDTESLKSSLAVSDIRPTEFKAPTYRASSREDVVVSGTSLRRAPLSGEERRQ